MQCDGTDDADVRYRLALQHMDRPPVVVRVEAEDVPACCVFDADTRI